MASSMRQVPQEVVDEIETFNTHLQEVAAKVERQVLLAYQQELDTLINHYKYSMIVKSIEEITPTYTVITDEDGCECRIAHISEPIHPLSLPELVLACSAPIHPMGGGAPYYNPAGIYVAISDTEAQETKLPPILRFISPDISKAVQNSPIDDGEAPTPSILQGAVDDDTIQAYDTPAAKQPPPTRPIGPMAFSLKDFPADFEILASGQQEIHPNYNLRNIDFKHATQTVMSSMQNRSATPPINQETDTKKQPEGRRRPPPLLMAGVTLNTNNVDSIDSAMPKAQVQSAPPNTTPPTGALSSASMFSPTSQGNLLQKKLESLASSRLQSPDSPREMIQRDNYLTLPMPQVFLPAKKSEEGCCSCFSALFSCLPRENVTRIENYRATPTTQTRALSKSHR